MNAEDREKWGEKNLLLDAAKLKFPNSAKSIRLERFNKIHKLCAWNVWDCVVDGQQYCRANEKQSVSSSDMLRGRAEVTTHTLINITLISGQVSICWASSLVYTDISACWGHRTHDSVVMDSSVVQWLTKQCISRNNTESVKKKSAPLIKEKFARKNGGIISFLIKKINYFINTSFFLRCTSWQWRLNNFLWRPHLSFSFW